MARANNIWFDQERSNPYYLLERQAQLMINLPVVIRGMTRSYDRMGTECEFSYEDRIWTGFIPEGATVNALRLDEKIKPRCISCGKEGLCIIHDWQGRCSTTLKSFWSNVRKVYWHRYSKNK